jgi:hypothetical protein
VWKTAGERIPDDATIARGVAAADAFLVAARAALEYLRSVGAEPQEPEAPAPATEPEAPEPR